MADIQSKILSRYGIDIAQENILKLYKIDSAEISSQDLEAKIQETRKRWTTSINGANEKNAERDRARLEKADKYEAVLKDDKLRKEVFQFYNKSSGSSAGEGSASGTGSTGFAREYFELVATTKKIKKADVDFFFKYYQSERKNKKAILEMLSKELKIAGLGKEGKYADEDDAVDEEGKKKDDTSPLIVNLFQEATVLKIRRAIEKYEEAAQSNELCQRYPKLRDGLFEYLEVKDVEDAKQFTELMAAKGKEVYAVRQERGAEYVPLVDLFNILQSIGDYRDVVDNIQELKLLLKYPNLTPYMFSFVEMRPNTVKGIVDVAKKEYPFRDETDFLLNYYKPIHSNFGISDGGITAILRKAEKKAAQNKVLNNIDEKLGRNKSKRRVSIGAEIIHWLVYWPIFVLYFIYEVVKVIFTNLQYLAIPIGVILFGLESWLLPKQGMENLFVLRKIFFKNQWLSYLDEFMGAAGVNWFETLILSLTAIIILLAVYLLPPLFVVLLIAKFSEDFSQRFDWVGIERTFRQVLATLKKKTEEQYTAQKKLFIKNKIPKVIINAVSLIVLIALIIVTPIGFRKLSETTGYFQKQEKVKDDVDDAAEEESNQSEEASDTMPVGDLMVITDSSANLRFGPGTDYEVAATASQGDVFVATGNQETASNGNIWYEVYLDAEMTQTGWGSQTVIGFQDGN
ncbi:MAG: SH3 domain-containing protein [Clostridium sp.]|nr:SH3 domain-containing protein [Clostridium sp.]